jgi:hypothetical protein
MNTELYTELHKLLKQEDTPWHSLFRTIDVVPIDYIHKKDKSQQTEEYVRNQNKLFLSLNSGKDLRTNWILYSLGDKLVLANNALHCKTDEPQTYVTSYLHQLSQRQIHTSFKHLVTSHYRTEINPVIETVYESKLLHCSSVEKLKDLLVFAKNFERTKRITMEQIMELEPDEDGLCKINNRVIICKHEIMLRRGIGLDKIVEECYNEITYCCKYCGASMSAYVQNDMMSIDAPEESLKLFNMFIKILDELGYNASTKRQLLLSTCLSVIYDYYVTNVNEQLKEVDNLATFVSLIESDRINLIFVLILYKLLAEHPKLLTISRGHALKDRLEGVFQRKKLTQIIIEKQTSLLDVSPVLTMIVGSENYGSSLDEIFIDKTDSSNTNCKPDYKYSSKETRYDNNIKHNHNTDLSLVKKIDTDDISDEDFIKTYCPVNKKHSFINSVCAGCGLNVKYDNINEVKTKYKDQLKSLDKLDDKSQNETGDHPQSKIEFVENESAIKPKQIEITADEAKEIMSQISKLVNKTTMELLKIANQHKDWFNKMYSLLTHITNAEVLTGTPLEMKIAALYTDKYLSFEVLSLFMQFT